MQLPGLVPTPHHTLRISSARQNCEIIDCETSGENFYPVITESTPSPGPVIEPVIEPTSSKLPPLAKPRFMTKTSTRTLLDLPNRRSSDDSGLGRTNSSCAGSVVNSPTSHGVVSRLDSNRSLVITNSASQAANLETYDPSQYTEEVGSVLSLDCKTDEDKNQLFVRRRSFSKTPDEMHSSAPTLRATTACSNGEENDVDVDKEERVEEGEGEEEGELEEEEEEDEGIVNIIPPKGWIKRIFWVLFLPLIIILFFTLPNVKKDVSLNKVEILVAIQYNNAVVCSSVV